MALDEDLSVFFSVDDFGVTVTSGAISGVGILDAPDDEILDGMVIARGYMLTAQASEFGGVQDGDALTIDGDDYTATSDARTIDDGKLVQIMLRID